MTVWVHGQLQNKRGGRLMETILRSFALAALCVYSNNVKAQQTPIELTLATVATQAQERSLSYEQARQEAVTARTVEKRVSGTRWGVVNFEGQYLRLDDPVVINSEVPARLASALGISKLPTNLAPQDNLHIALKAGIPLYTGGKILHARRQAQAGVRAADAMSDYSCDDSVYEAEKRYLGVLLAKEVLNLQSDALISYQEHLAHAQSSYRQGSAANYDVIRAEAAVTEQEKRLIEARNQLDLILASLREVLDYEDSVSITVNGKLFEIVDVVVLDEALSASIKNNPALHALQEKIVAEHNDVRVQQGDFMPQLEAMAMREMVDNKLAQTDSTWVVGARISLNLFDGGQRRARVEEARSQLLSAQIQYKRAEDDIRLAVRSSYLTMHSQQAALASARKAAELAAESQRLAAKRFEVGVGTSLEVLDATLSLTAARVGEQQALYGIDLAYLSIHRYQGDIVEVVSRIQK